VYNRTVYTGVEVDPWFCLGGILIANIHSSDKSLATVDCLLKIIE
jgi:hypothetical protein